MADDLDYELVELKGILEASPEYKNWAGKNAGFYLVHMFLMSGHPPQLGYYNKNTDKIVTFDISFKSTDHAGAGGNADKDIGMTEVNINPASDVLKESGVVELLALEDINTNLSDAVLAAKNFASESQPGQIIDKRIIILQMINRKAVYNITLITRSFKTINVKINAKTGGIEETKVSSIMDLGIK